MRPRPGRSPSCCRVSNPTIPWPSSRVAPATLKLGGAKTQIGAAIRSIESVVSGSSARLILVLEDGFEARGFREDDAFVVDIARPKPAIAPPEAGFEPAAQPLAERPAEAPAAPPRADRCVQRGHPAGRLHGPSLCAHRP